MAGFLDHPDFFVRWHVMRELLGLDAAAALPHLKRMAARRSPSRPAPRRALGARPRSRRRPAARPPDMPRIISCPDDGRDRARRPVRGAERRALRSGATRTASPPPAPLLKRLANNRDFLADIAIAELKDRCARQSLENRYSSQVIMLHRASEKFSSAPISGRRERDSVFKASGTSPFFYHVPHDHNFSFLTVGYLGPGYWSDYYEYDYEKVVGLPGEKVDLRFVEKVAARAGQGDALPRPPRRPRPAARRRDVGLDQHHGSLARAALPQPVPVRREDMRDRRHPQPAPRAKSLLALAANHGGGNGRDLVESFAAAPSLRPHPVRRAARARRRGAEIVDGGLDVLARGARLAGPRSSPAMSAREMRADRGEPEPGSSAERDAPRHGLSEQRRAQPLAGALRCSAPRSCRARSIGLRTG